jgi:anaerobic selenocysteine-containing dehydrogenase
MIRKRSVCPHDCPDTCGLLVEVEGGRVLSVSGDPEHPYSHGTLCPKVNHYQDTVHSPDRLTRPLERIGPKGAGTFRPISWDAAIARVAERWKELVAAHGGESILPYSYAGTMGLVQRNAGHAFFHRLGASRLDRTICSPAKGLGWSAVMGETMAQSPEEARQSDLVILWSTNTVATNVHFLERVKAARAAGAQVWLIETYRTRTARLADRVVLVRPGSDGALALGLMHLLVRDGLVDRDFVARQVQGFEELTTQVLPQFPPQRVSRFIGLTVQELEELARAYGRARAPFIRLGDGLSRYGNGAMTVRCIACLPALVGAYGKPGGGLLASTSSAQAFDLVAVTRPDFLQRPTRTVNMCLLGQALNQLHPPVRSLYVYHSNPAAVAPDQNAVLRGLAREDLFTVVHERFLTDTARWADLVLPATSMLEHDDLYRSYGHYCIQRTEPVIPPVGESRSNWQVFQALAVAMGYDEPFFRRSAPELVDELLAAPSSLRQGIDAQALAEGRAVELHLPAASERRWGTPSGRIEILNPALDPPLPDWLPTHEEAGALPLRLMTAPALHTLNSSFMERESLRDQQGPMRLKMNPADAASRQLADSSRVVACNDLGEVTFQLEVTGDVPVGLVVAEGVYWKVHSPGARTVNALTSQRLTDRGGGSTFYDNRVEVYGEAGRAPGKQTGGMG